jgi:SAM-dependent methyltransferase
VCDFPDDRLKLSDALRSLPANLAIRLRSFPFPRSTAGRDTNDTNSTTTRHRHDTDRTYYGCGTASAASDTNEQENSNAPGQCDWEFTCLSPLPRTKTRNGRRSRGLRIGLIVAVLIVAGVGYAVHACPLTPKSRHVQCAPRRNVLTENPAYALGHSAGELERLSIQSRFVGPITREFFREAGVSAGMRVLDVGSGAGDVAFLAADLVGETGEVIGTDRVATASATAKQRAAAKGLRNVSFRVGDPAEIAFDRPFDAVVGRYVLLFQADAAGMVRSLIRQHLRPGGLIVFHEPDWTNARSHPRAPTYDRCCQWIVDAFREAGTDTNAANNLYAGRSRVRACRFPSCGFMRLVASMF